MLISNLEFYTFESDLYVKDATGCSKKVSDADIDLINQLILLIQSKYNIAYQRLYSLYAKSATNKTFFNYLIVKRFCKCNFGNIDNVADVGYNSTFFLERVPCPLRGECDHEDVICNPTFTHPFSPAQLRVLRLLVLNLTRKEIATKLCISTHTVHNHIRNAFNKLDLKSERQFLKYININNIKL